MCGIVGASSTHENTEFWIKDALVELNKRGPDATGFARSNHIIFGATRLAMVDPQVRSNQPFARGQSLLVFNGEIYNFRIVKSRLSNRVKFVTDSDTELLSYILQEEGIEGLTRLNGMYSFAFYEELSQQFFLARDRLGKKPLYFRISREGDALSFCSLQTPLRKIGKAELNHVALISYLHLGFVVDPLTMSSEVQSLRPQESLTIKRDLKQLSISSNRIGELRSTPEGNLRKLVTECIMSRIHGDNSVSISLSGGVDSTIIAIVLAEQGVDATAFSVRWPDSDKDRYNYDFETARKTAGKLGLNFVAVKGPDSIEIPDFLEEYLEIMEEPNNNPTGLSMISLFREIASHGFRLTLTGDGSDEIFGGYDRYRLINRYKRLVNVIQFPRQDNPVKSSKLNGFSRLTARTWSDWASWHQVFSRYELTDELMLKREHVDDAFQFFQGEFNEFGFPSGGSALKRMMALDKKIWLSMESNRRLDRVSMSYSVEARSPFQDDLLNVLWCDLSNREISQGIGKVDLLRAFPEIEKLEVLSKKTGFSSPLGHWLRANSEWVLRHVNWLKRYENIGPRIRSAPEMQADLRSGDFRKLQKIWTLVVISVWLQRMQAKEDFPNE